MIKCRKSNLLIGVSIMSKVVSCSLIIRDDFNNVLLLKKKVKRGQIEEWSLLNQKKRSKEEHEKTIHRGVKDILKSIVFELEPINEYSINEDESAMVYLGILKEKITLDKNYKEAKWINVNDIDNFEINNLDKKILKDYFAKR